MSLLIIERGANTGTRIPLTVFPVSIGRDAGNDIMLHDEECSRFHLRLKQRGRLIIAEDLDSRNGTYINGDRILNSIVKNGDKILIGATEFSFVTSEPDIQLATEIMDFDMLVAEELGLDGPIDVIANKPSKKFKPQRLNQIGIVNQLSSDAASIKKIFDLHGNIISVDELEEAARTYIKSISKLMKSAARAAFFVWTNSNRQLIPLASKHYTKKQSFLLSQRAMEDVITRKQGVILQAESEVTYSGRHRLIIPMIHNDNPICLIHIESDNLKQPFPPHEVDLVQAFTSRCAPSFEALLLRRELDAWLVGMIETMIATVEAKDTYTRGHSERVSKYSMAIAEELRLNRETKKLLMISSLCHDVGKIGIPDLILKKASLLSAEEYDEMKLHPTIGADIINHMPNAKRFISGVKHHHEKWDGTGYPDALVGEEIPFFGRIVGLADVYDAMVSGRAYSGFMNQTDAAERLLEEKELFDPEILKAFIRAYEKGTLTIKTDTLNQKFPDQYAKRRRLFTADEGSEVTPPPKENKKKKST